MNFSNADLKRLKDIFDKCDCTGTIDMVFESLGHIKMKTLLARLEAAEAWGEYTVDQIPGAHNFTLYRAWRRSCGEEKNG